jgi:mono/diheme cytochrome c family protein
MSHQLPNAKELFAKAANDDHGRVRLEAVVAASWQDKELGLKVLNLAENKPVDLWMEKTYKAVRKNFNTRIKPEEIFTENDLVSGLKGEDLRLLQNGRKLYEKEGNCVQCHQVNGRGLEASGFPPLANSEWVKDEKKLIQVTLNGLMGPISVLGKKYEGRVPMIPYGGLMTDEEIASVLTYVRRSWGNRLDPVKPATVAKVRKETATKKGYYLGSELQ